MTTEYRRCPVCGDRIRVNADGTLRVHLQRVDGVPRWGRETCRGSATRVVGS